MKNIFIYLAFIFSIIPTLFAQQKFKEIHVSKKEPNYWINIISYDFLSGKNKGHLLNFIQFRYKYLNIGIGSSFDINVKDDYPEPQNFLLPAGLYLPIHSGLIKQPYFSYSMGINSNFYLLPIKGMEKDATPRIAELSLRFDTALLSFSTGYRFQFGKWAKETFTIAGSYSKDLGRSDGFFFKISIGLQSTIPGKTRVETKKILLPNPSLFLYAKFSDKSNKIIVGKDKELLILIKNSGKGEAENTKLDVEILDKGWSLIKKERFIGNIKENSSRLIKIPIRLENISYSCNSVLKIVLNDNDGFNAVKNLNILIEPQKEFVLDETKPENKKTESQKDFALNETIPKKHVYVVADLANIRKGPGTTYDIVFKANYCDKLEVIEDQQLWINVRDVSTLKEGWIYSKLISENKPVMKIRKDKSKIVNQIDDGIGYFMNYTFRYKKFDDTYTVIFSPFLPRDDGIIISAMWSVMSKIYGKHKGVNLMPQILNRQGTNLLLFEGINYNYLILLIKQDTGEVNSISLWRESK